VENTHSPGKLSLCQPLSRPACWAIDGPRRAKLSYQATDREIIDYQLTRLPGTEFAARAPLPSHLDGSVPFICAMGAAQTFGRFAERPFLALLGNRLGAETLNLGSAGAGPRHYLRRPKVLEIINRSSLVILQVMSGRSVSNSYFENVYAGSLRPWSAPKDEKPRHAEIAYTELFETKGEAFIRALIAETRRNYINEYIELIRAIKAPILLFWFSQRATNYTELYAHGVDRASGGFLGGFPQLVNSEMIAKLRPYVNSYVECITSRGLPQELRSRQTGNIVDIGISPLYPGHNNYYPSPEMHEDAAAALESAVTSIFRSSLTNSDKKQPGDAAE
jgi:hypothetical protein